ASIDTGKARKITLPERFGVGRSSFKLSGARRTMRWEAPVVRSRLPSLLADQHALLPHLFEQPRGGCRRRSGVLTGGEQATGDNENAPVLGPFELAAFGLEFVLDDGRHYLR